MTSAVVTGSTRGLGFALADAFAARKIDVMITGRTQDAVDKSVTALRSKHAGARIEGRAVDVANYDACAALFKAAKDAFGSVDIWINNAGLGGNPAAFAESPSNDIGPVVAVNLIGAMNGARVALEGMKAQARGQIFNVEGFGSGGQRREGMAVYGATKVAIRYFTSSIIDETKGGPVRVGTIIPGLVATDMLAVQARAATAKRRSLYNALADLPETIAPFLVDKVLANQAHGARISWLNGPKIIGRWLSPSARKRQLLPR
jgi:short-subunit dehydrogenase